MEKKTEDLFEKNLEDILKPEESFGKSCTSVISDPINFQQVNKISQNIFKPKKSHNISHATEVTVRICAAMAVLALLVIFAIRASGR